MWECVIFKDILEAHDCNWEKAFSEFSKQRRVDTDAIANLAKNNFLEMRDHVRCQAPLLVLIRKVSGNLYRAYLFINTEGA